MTEADYARIDGHASCCYVRTELGGSIAAATRLATFATGLLDAGGYAVKVDSTGNAHAASTWRELNDNPSPAELVHLWVTWVAESDTSFTSCGMHNLGLPDVLVTAETDPQVAFRAMRGLCVYLVAEPAVLRNAQTFSPDAESPRWRLERGRSTFEADSIFFNPFGVWALSAA